ncbi:MAG: hypothetical protein WC365_09975 [Candidatus Babeliales bacterium]|jgi:hypothetical protein
MTQEFINRLFAAMMGKKKVFFPVNEDLLPYHWSPSSEGETTKEVRDFMKGEFPKEWKRYLEKTQYDVKVYPKIFNAQLSITNLAQFIMDNYKEMFYETCNAEGDAEIICPACPNFNNWDCDGKIIIPRFAEAVEIIRRELDGTV